MDGVLRLEFPWSMLCSDNERHKGGKRKYAHSERYIESRESLKTSGMVQVQNEGVRRPAFPRDEVYLYMRFFPPDNRRRDCWNMNKGLLDALQGVVWANDDQVTELHGAREVVDRKNPRVEIEVRRRVPE